MDINYYYLATISLMYNDDTAGFRYYYSYVMSDRNQHLISPINLHPERILVSTRAHPSHTVTNKFHQFPFYYCQDSVRQNRPHQLVCWLANRRLSPPNVIHSIGIHSRQGSFGDVVCICDLVIKSSSFLFLLVQPFDILFN